MSSSSVSVLASSLFKQTLLVLALLSFSLSAEAQQDFSECESCQTRKVSLCTKECAATAYQHQRQCRMDCIKEYCSHRCPPSAAEPDSAKKQTCNECQTEEFNYCTPLCDLGTSDDISECKQMCAELRCKSTCEKITENDKRSGSGKKEELKEEANTKN